MQTTTIDISTHSTDRSNRSAERLEAPAIVDPQQPTVIDMLTPEAACARLALDGDAVVALVNEGRLAAYRIAGEIRFRVTDVARCEHARIAA